MKRDMDLIRLLLERVEEDQDLEVPDYSMKQVLYHLVLMEEAGLVVGPIISGQDGEPASAMIQRLTNKGHDFLDSARNETVWAKFKEKVRKSGGAVALDVATDLLKSLAKQSLMGSGGDS